MEPASSEVITDDDNKLTLTTVREKTPMTTDQSIGKSYGERERERENVIRPESHRNKPGSGGSSSTMVKLTNEGDPITTPGDALRTISKFSSPSGKTSSIRGTATVTSVTPEANGIVILTASKSSLAVDNFSNTYTINY